MTIFQPIIATNFLFYSSLLSFSLFLGAFIINRKHLLLTLLTLEGLMLIVFCILTWVSAHRAPMDIFVLVFLALVVCERALRLSLLVGVVRTHGRDHFGTINSLQC